MLRGRCSRSALRCLVRRPSLPHAHSSAGQGSAATSCRRWAIRARHVPAHRLHAGRAARALASPVDAFSAQPAQPHANTLKATLGRCFSGPRQGCFPAVVPCRFLPLPHRQVWRTSTRCLQSLCTLRWASWCSPCAGRGVRRRRRLPSSMWKSRRLVAPHGCLGGAWLWPGKGRPSFSSRLEAFCTHNTQAERKAKQLRAFPPALLFSTGQWGGVVLPTA